MMTDIFVKLIFIFMAVAAMIACNSDSSSEGDDEVQEEGVTQGMLDFWMEQRNKFIKGAEFQIDELESELEGKEDTLKAQELEAELETLRERVSEMEQEGEFEWEDSRDDIANSLINIRREIEDME